MRQFTQMGKRNNRSAVASHVVGEIRLSQEEGKEEAKTGGREERVYRKSDTENQSGGKKQRGGEREKRTPETEGWKQSIE